jgi:hypothetical protein
MSCISVVAYTIRNEAEGKKDLINDHMRPIKDFYFLKSSVMVVCLAALFNLLVISRFIKPNLWSSSLFSCFAASDSSNLSKYIALMRARAASLPPPRLPSRAQISLLHSIDLHSQLRHLVRSAPEHRLTQRPIKDLTEVSPAIDSLCLINLLSVKQTGRRHLLLNWPDFKEIADNWCVLADVCFRHAIWGADYMCYLQW